MSTLWDRPNGPTSGAASVPNQIPLNQQGAQSGPLPALLTLTGTAETIMPSAELASVALTCALGPDTAIEQTLFNLIGSGIVTTENSTNITIKVYEGAAIVSGNLLGSSGAIAVNTATAGWWARADLMFDSVSGALVGTIQFYLNKQVVAAVTLSNFVTGFVNNDNLSANPPVTANLPVFSLSFQSSAASANNPTTVNVQKWTCG